MIYLKLFLNFLMIGALSFGGGYGMVSLVRETVISNGWLTESEFLNFIAVSESTPGPLAVNMATFIGSTQGGILGSFLATLGVVLPSFVIILLIAAVLKNLMKYAGVNAFLSGVRPCVIAMILVTAIGMAISTLLGFTDIYSALAPDPKSILVFAILWLTHFGYKRIKKTAPSPIIMILFSAALGMLLWEYKTQPVPICRPKPGGFAVFTEIYCLLFQTDGRRHCRIIHFAVTVTPATLIKDQIFSNHFPVSYKKAQRRRVLNLCGVVLLSIGHFLKVSLCEPAFMRASGICFIKWL